jgi:hypothetical protein
MADSAEADRLYSGSGTTPEGSEAFRVRLVSETSSSLQNSILTVRETASYTSTVLHSPSAGLKGINPSLTSTDIGRL